MFNNYQNEALSQLRQQEHMQEAENSRLATPRPTPFYAPALAQLGSTLINMGNDLQDRYGELCDEIHQPAPSRSTPQPAPQR